VSDVELHDDEASLLKLLPTDGSTTSNPKLIKRLRWDEERYWLARDGLVDRGLAVRGRGRGGTIRRLLENEVTESISVPAEDFDAGKIAAAAVDAIRQEKDLYEPIAKVLRRDWAKDRRSTPLGVEIIAFQGKRATGGTWSRPDIVSIEVRNFIYLPSKILDVVTFEVKPHSSIDVQAVYEAVAHRRSSTHAYVILHVPSSDVGRLEEDIRVVRAVARSHGVGVITVDDPADYSTWEELEEATRVEPDPARLHEFIETQIPATIKTAIISELR